MSRSLKRLAISLVLLLAVGALLFFSLPLPGTIPVLMYHYIGTPEQAAREGNFVSSESFSRQMDFLKAFRYRVLTMEEYGAIKTGKRKPQGRELLITFDDGHRSFKNHAVPVLQRHHFPAVMFLISDSVKNGGLMGYGDSLNIQEIKDLQKNPGFSFQGHTKTHWHLKEMSDAEVKTELFESKQALEAMLGKPVDYLSYPFGEVDQRVMEMTKKAGYKLAFSTSFKKLAAIPEGPYTVTRAKISDSSSHLIVFWYHVSGIHQVFKEFRQKMKYGWT